MDLSRFPVFREILATAIFHWLKPVRNHDFKVTCRGFEVSGLQSFGAFPATRSFQSELVIFGHVENPCYNELYEFYEYMCQGLNSQYFHIIGDGHQPNSRGLYTHYKDSY